MTVKKQYEVVAVDGVCLTGGIISLTDEQFQSRSHCLAASSVKGGGKNTYQIKAPITFKRGEVFGFFGSVPKALFHALLELSHARVTKPETLLTFPEPGDKIAV